MKLEKAQSIFMYQTTMTLRLPIVSVGINCSLSSILLDYFYHSILSSKVQQ